MNVFNRLKSNSSVGLKSRTPSPTQEYGPVSHEPKLTTPANFSPVTHAQLDTEQEAKVVRLREYIHSIMLPETHEYYPSEKGFVTDDTIKRYMRARKWDYEVKIFSSSKFREINITIASKNHVGKYCSLET